MLKQASFNQVPSNGQYIPMENILKRIVNCYVF